MQQQDTSWRNHLLAQRPTSLAALTVILLLTLTTHAAADDPSQEAQLKRGQQLYRAQCASCHGPQGEGVEDAYAERLTGNLALGELSKLIAETMPEDDPDSCEGADAEAVAAYVYKAFYSEAAQAGTQQPKIKLARLTADQLRSSLADLYAHFAGTASWKDSGGLQGHYYDGARARRGNRKIDRLDQVVDFDFGNDGPGKGINPKDYHIQWSGSIRVDVTGSYEIVIRSTCAFVCYLGDDRREFINNHVQSGDKSEFRRSITLTAGRVYPVHINFFQRKRKTKQPPARFSLCWIPPYGIEQVVPSDNLIPADSPATFSLQAKLPPDDRSYGYERGISVNRQWDDSTTAAAIEFGQVAATELWPRYRQRSKSSGKDREQLKQFLTELVETAFRGPVDEPLRKLYIDSQIESIADDSEAIRRVCLMALKSPRFLYPSLDHDRSTSQQTANRLTLVMFDSLPSDKWLLDQVKKQQLDDEKQIRQAAHRMLKDDRVRGKTRALMYDWLNLQHIAEITKDAEKFPGFDDHLVSDLRSSLDRFLDDVIWSNESDYRKLFLANRAFTTRRLSEFYGEAWSMNAEGEQGLQLTKPNDQRHFGILSHPYLMSGLAYPDSTSPIHRGVFVIRHMLGRTLRPPNEAFTPLSPKLHPDLTTRQRVTLQTSPKNCQMCHSRINQLGFTLENFDAAGRYREKQLDRQIDASGSYTSRADREIEFGGPRDLAEFLAGDHDAHQAFVHRAFQHFVKQPPAAYGPETLDILTKRFEKNRFNIQELLVDIAVIAASEPLHSNSEQHVSTQ